ncbi:MAG: dihydrofolate reductase [Xanthomonadales bacterium]|nr:dihydrofolate reductase [Xanthomonadales bacterium]
MLAGKRIALIVAMDRNRAIGRDGDMPWHLPADLRHFKATTMDHAVIMGRKTFDSIGRPLPRRQNIVLTRDHGWRGDGVQVVHDLDAAIRLAMTDPVFVIGGGELYRAVLPAADLLFVTEIDTQVRGADTFFPEIDPSRWTEESRSEHFADERNPFSLCFVKYTRKVA